MCKGCVAVRCHDGARRRSELKSEFDCVFLFSRAASVTCTGKKTPGGAGTHTRDTHTDGTHGRTRAHPDHTDEPHNHPNPTTHPHDHATAETAPDSTAAGTEPTTPRGRQAADSEEAAPSKPDPASTRSQSASPRSKVHVPVKRHRGEPGHTHGTHMRTRGHMDHTDEPHNHPNPTTHPHDHVRYTLLRNSSQSARKPYAVFFCLTQLCVKRL